MNALQNDQKQGTARQEESPATTSIFELLKMGKSVGPVGDLVLKFRTGELVPADTGDQRGGQTEYESSPGSK
jgi:hypothetical protein